MEGRFSLEDSIARPRGIFSLAVYRHGRLVERMAAENLVVNGSKAVLASLLGGSVANMSVTQIGYGTNGAAPAAGNTTLTAPYARPVDNVTYPVAGTVSFDFSLGTGEANGLAISEFGLLTAGGTLFARRVRAAPLAKDNTISLAGTWQIIF